MGEYNCFKGKRVLVTGGCGFIGSHLVRRVLEEDGEVYTAGRGRAGTWRLRDVEGRIHMHTLDITDSQGVDSLAANIRPDYVFHLAAYGVDSKDSDYSMAVKTNVLGTINLINALGKMGCRKVINLGSSAEYGNMRMRMREDMYPCPVSIYGCTKACATIAAHQSARENHMDIVTLRPFGVFGEGEEMHKLFSYVITSLVKERDVELTGCEQKRDYCYVEDVVDGMMMAACQEGINDEIFNIGSGKLHPLRYYIDMIFKAFGTDKKPLYGLMEYRTNEMWFPKPDLSKIRTMLGWRPRIGLEEGIKRTVAWYKANANLLG